MTKYRKYKHKTMIKRTYLRNEVHSGENPNLILRNPD